MSLLWILKRILWEQPTELYPESYKLKVIFFVPSTDISDAHEPIPERGRFFALS